MEDIFSTLYEHRFHAAIVVAILSMITISIPSKKFVSLSQRAPHLIPLYTIIIFMFQGAIAAFWVSLALIKISIHTDPSPKNPTKIQDMQQHIQNKLTIAGVKKIYYILLALFFYVNLSKISTIVALLSEKT